jgi:transcriptional regulator with GAF, ATPase, and Fis domain
VSELATESTLDPRSSAVGDAPSERLRTLYDIGRQLFEQVDSDALVRTIQQALVEHAEPDHACILKVLSPEGYEPVSSHELDLNGPPDDWRVSFTAIGRCREQGLAILATDVLRDPKFEESGSIQKLHIRSVICVPLGSEPVRGVVYLDRRSRSRPFAREDLHFVTAVSAYAALALQRLEDYAETREALHLSDERFEALQRELLRHHIVGSSTRLLESYAMLRKLADRGARVVLRGETGTGKELFARAYAAHAKRTNKPYVPVSIPSLAPTLLESELFGHVRGAFTEARKDKKGYLEVADGGILFLDEIGDLEPALQVKLLRFLDSGELYRVGDTQPRFIDTLVVSATNRNLEKLVEQERFRADLLARLGHTIVIPPLRERPEDIPLLVEHFVRMYCRGTRAKRFSPEALNLMQRYPWEFNVRQLQQVVERVVCLLDDDLVRPDDLPAFLREEPSTPLPAAASGDVAFCPGPLRDVVDAAEKEHILRTLEHTHGNRRKAIELLDLSSDTFYKRLKRYGLLERDSST